MLCARCRPELLFKTRDVPDYILQMGQQAFLQYSRSDIMLGTADVLPHVGVGTDEIILPAFQIIAGAGMYGLLLQSAQQETPANRLLFPVFCWAAFVLPKRLYPFPCVQINNRFMGIFKDDLLFFRISTLMFGAVFKFTMCSKYSLRSRI